MITSTRSQIADRILADLRQFPPYSMIPVEELAELVRHSAVKAFAKGDHIWLQGGECPGHAHFLARGRVEYHLDSARGDELIDLREQGDTLGLAALIDEVPFRVAAVAVEDSLCYLLQWRELHRLLEAHSAAREHVYRHLLWSVRLGGGRHGRPSLGDRIRIIGESSVVQTLWTGSRQVRTNGRTPCCHPRETVREAAARLCRNHDPAIAVVDEQGHPVGILTSNRIIRHVVVEQGSPELLVGELMSSPVFAVERDSSATAAMLLMLRKRVGQVCVTEDGGIDSPFVGLCTHKDLLTIERNHPVNLLNQIHDLRDSDAIRRWCLHVEEMVAENLEMETPGVFIGQICSELFDELVRHLIELGTRELENLGVAMPKVAWTWVAVGSEGRRELVQRTDIDNAILFESSGDPDTDEGNRRVLVRLAARVVEHLVACGFTRCQGGIMASNPRWCRTDREWEHEIARVNAFSPSADLLRALVIYDMRFVAGDASLCRRLRGFLYEDIRQKRSLLIRMAGLVLKARPPLNILGKSVVQRRGMHAGSLDLKALAIAPLRDAARIYCLHHDIKDRQSTGGRWEGIRQQVPELAEVAGLSIEAMSLLLRLRWRTALKEGSRGTRIDPGNLTRLECAQLVNIFDVVRMVQDALRQSFPGIMVGR